MRSISLKITLSEGKGKEKEKKKQQGGRMEEKKQKAMVALLGFILARDSFRGSLAIVFDKKRLLDGRGLWQRFQKSGWIYLLAIMCRGYYTLQKQACSCEMTQIFNSKFLRRKRPPISQFTSCKKGTGQCDQGTENASLEMWTTTQV